MKQYLLTVALLVLVLCSACLKYDDTVPKRPIDPLAFDYLTSWVAVEKLDDEGSWEEHLQGDTLLLTFNYFREEDGSIVENLLLTKGIFAVLSASGADKFAGTYQFLNDSITFSLPQVRAGYPYRAAASYISYADELIADTLVLENRLVDSIDSYKYVNVEFVKLQ